MTLLDAARAAAEWLEQYGGTESEALLSSALRAAIAREEERQEIIEGLVEAARLLLEVAEQTSHTDRLCGTTTILANGSFFIEGCACGRDAAVEDTRAALARYDAMKEDDRG
jgi:hypothetical protein